MSEIKYEIVKKVGVLSKAGSGWAKELNLISWNDREPKYDIRDWSADGAKMEKGVILSKEELSPPFHYGDATQPTGRCAVRFERVIEQH